MIHFRRDLFVANIAQRCRTGFLCCMVCLGGVMASGSIFAATADPANQVAAHLAAGEFGLALAAANAADPAQKPTLVQSVAAAQQAAGEPATAVGSLKRISRTSNPATGDGSGVMTNLAGFGGGGSQANYGPLMQIIQNNTSGKWSQADGDGGQQTPYQQGIRVAPNGLLHRLTNEEQTGMLAMLGVQARKADLNADVSQRSSLRFVSLTRLERRVAQRLSEGLSIPETMSQLAGLSQIKYVIVDTENHDILIGGPAEPWEYNSQGMPVGVSSQRPTLQLDDFVTVLRTFARREVDFGCSINTTESGMKAVTEFAEQSSAKGPISSTSVRNWVNQLQRKLGRQEIQIWGVPSDSHVARVIVEADYRMKLIGIDKLNVGKEIPSYFDLLAANQSKEAPPMEALRWWLTMKYDALMHSADKSVYEIQGSSVLCQSENQFLTSEGKHLPTGKSEGTNRLFAETFTTHYAKLAAKDPVFAEMQNIFDLALVSALIQHEKLTAKVGWDLGAFMPQGEYATARYAVPKEIDSVVNHRVFNGKDIVVQVAGGVRADLMSVVKDAKLNQESPRLGAVGQAAKPTNVQEGRWWWDMAR